MATFCSRLRRRLLRCVGAMPVDVAQLGFELVDAPHETPPIDLELRLAGAAGTDAGCARGHAARLLRQIPALAANARQPVAQQRQLDLRLALLAVRVLGEDVEDHRGAVDRRASEQLLEVELLRRRQLVVEHDGVGVDRQRHFAELLGLALADVGRRVGAVPALHDTGHLVGTGGVHELRELVERRLDVVGVRAVEGDADEHELLAGLAGDEGVGQCVVHAAHDRSSATWTTGTVISMVAPSTMSAGPPG